MKKVSTLLVAGSLLLGGLGTSLLTSCETPTQTGTSLQEAAYAISFDLSVESTVSVKLNVKDNQAIAGTKVEVELVGTVPGVTYSLHCEDVTIEKIDDCHFSFVMPSSHVKLTLKKTDNLLTAAMLQELATGYKFETLMEEDVNGNITYSYLETEAVKDKFSLKTYAKAPSKEGADKTKRTFFESYYKNVDGNVTSRRIAISNKPVYYEVLAPDGSMVFPWSAAGYDNFFGLVKETDFARDPATGWFVLDGTKKELEPARVAAMTQIYGTPGLQLDSIALKVENGGIASIKTVSKEFVGATSRYNYTFETKILEKGNVAFSDAYVPFTGGSIAEIDELVAKLKLHNYTMKIDNVEKGVAWPSHIFKANADKLHYEYYDSFSETVENVGYYVVNGESQEVHKEGADYIKAGTPEPGDVLPLLFPDFDISSSVFEKVNGVYRLKKGVDGDIGDFTLLEAAAAELSDFSLEVKQGSYVLTNAYGQNKTTITISDLGTTDVGFTPETVKEPVKLPSTWQELLPAEYASLVAAYGEAFTTLPFPGFITKAGIDLIGDPSMYSLFQFEGLTGSTWVQDYGDLLVAAGWAKQPSTTDYLGAGTPCYTKAFGATTYAVQVLEMPFAEVGAPSFTILFGNAANF